MSLSPPYPANPTLTKIASIRSLGSNSGGQAEADGTDFKVDRNAMNIIRNFDDSDSGPSRSAASDMSPPRTELVLGTHKGQTSVDAKDSR